MSIPNAEVLLPLPWPVTTITQRPVARLAALGLGAAAVAGTVRDVDVLGAVAGEMIVLRGGQRLLTAHAAPPRSWSASADELVQLRARRGCEGAGEAEAHGPVLGVDDVDRAARTAERARPRAGSRRPGR